MAHLCICPNCGRHILHTTCPFCSSSKPRRRAIAPIVLGSALALGAAGCGGDDDPSPADANVADVNPRDGDLSDANPGDANPGDGNTADADPRDADIGDADLGDANPGDARVDGPVAVPAYGIPPDDPN